MASFATTPSQTSTAPAGGERADVASRIRRLSGGSGGGDTPPSGALLRRAPFLETEEEAAAHPNRTYYYRAEASADAVLRRCDAELTKAEGEAARALRRERAAAHCRNNDFSKALEDLTAALELSVGALDADGAAPRGNQTAPVPSRCSFFCAQRGACMLLNIFSAK